MRINYSWLFALLLTTTFFSCGETHELKLNLEEGKVYSQQYSVKTDMTQSFLGGSQDMQMVMSGVLNFDVQEKNAASYSTKVNFDQINMEVYSEGEVFSFGSGQSSDGEEDMLNQILGNISNLHFDIEMSDRGSIDSILNLDQLFVRAFEDLPLLSEQEIQQIKLQLEQSFGEANFKGNFESVSGNLPPKPVKVGQSWKVEQEMSSDFPAIVRNTFKLAEITDDYALIEGKGTIDFNLETDSIQQAQFEMTGTTESSIKIDRKTGWVIEGKIIQDIGGDVVFGDGFGGESMSMSMEVDNVIEVSN